MPNAHVMEQSRPIPVDVDTAFRRTLPMPLPAFAALWRGFARQGLEQLSIELLRS